VDNVADAGPVVLVVSSSNFRTYEVSAHLDAVVNAPVLCAGIPPPVVFGRLMPTRVFHLVDISCRHCIGTVVQSPGLSRRRAASLVENDTLPERDVFQFLPLLVSLCAHHVYDMARLSYPTPWGRATCPPYS